MNSLRKEENVYAALCNVYTNVNPFLTDYVKGTKERIGNAAVAVVHKYLVQEGDDPIYVINYAQSLRLNAQKGHTGLLRNLSHYLCKEDLPEECKGLLECLKAFGLE
jgi:hypothetical protein